MEQRLLDIRTITADGPRIQFTATQQERETIAKRFDIPEVLSLEVEGAFSYQDHITFDGVMTASAKRTCVSTLNLFTESTKTPVHLLFSESGKEESDNPDDADILPIQKGKINLFEVFSEEYGLSLNPFPKSIDTYCDYREESENTPKNNPFSILKNLKK